MLMGLLFAVTIVLLLRFIRPERLLDVQSLPDVTAFFATLQSPVTPFLPSFWAGESLFSALRGQVDLLHLGALWTTALALTVLARAAYGRHYFAAWSKAQEARKARFTRLSLLEPLVRRLPFAPARRALLVKDVKVFLRDTTQWSQLLLLLALALVYVYNFRVLDLDRIPYMSRVIKNAYAFVNLAMAAFVTAAVAVRFVFPAVSAEGPAFWIVRTAPVRMSSFLWSKLWTGLLPILVLAELITVTSNQLLGVPLVLKLLGAGAIAFMTLALVGLACGMGAQHPRFGAENVTQVAGSYGGVAFMVLAVLYILVTVALLGLARLAVPLARVPRPAARAAPAGLDGAVPAPGLVVEPHDLLGLDEKGRPGPRGARLGRGARSETGNPATIEDRDEEKPHPHRPGRRGRPGIRAPRRRPEHVRHEDPGRGRHRRAGRGHPARRGRPRPRRRGQPEGRRGAGRGAPADEGRPRRGPPGELPPRRERRPARRQGPLQPRAPLAPREGEARAREGRLPRGRGAGERPRDPHRGQLRQRRPRDEGAPPRRRRPGHGGVRPRALPVHGRPGLRALRGEPQGLAPAQGDRGQPPLLRGPPGRAAPPRRDRGGHPARGRHQDAGGLRAAPLPRHRGHPAGEPHPAEPAQARGGDRRPPDPGRRGRRPLPLGARLRRRQAQHHLLPLVLARGERALRGARGEGEGDDGLRGEARPDHRGHGLPRERPRRDRRRGPGPVVRPDPREPEEEDRRRSEPSPTTRSWSACKQELDALISR